jgi:hypothetical protein
MSTKYRTQFFMVNNARLTAGDVHEHYGVNLDDLLGMYEEDTQYFTVNGYDVVVTRCGEYH